MVLDGQTWFLQYLLAWGMFSTLDEILLVANCPLKSQLSHIWNQKNVPVLDHILSHMETLDDFYCIVETVQL